MDIEKMTTTMQEALGSAQQIAQVRHHQVIEVPHLWRIFVQPNSFGANFYKDLGIDLDDFTNLIEKEIDKINSVEGSNITYGQNLSPDLFQIFTEADISMTLSCGLNASRQEARRRRSH